MVVDPKHAGKKAQCPSCKQIFQLPAELGPSNQSTGGVAPSLPSQSQIAPNDPLGVGLAENPPLTDPLDDPTLGNNVGGMLYSKPRQFAGQTKTTVARRKALEKARAGSTIPDRTEEVEEKEYEWHLTLKGIFSSLCIALASAVIWLIFWGVSDAEFSWLFTIGTGAFIGWAAGKLSQNANAAYCGLVSLFVVFSYLFAKFLIG